MFSQVSVPEKGDYIALLKTNMGDIKIRLFKDKAPKAVENFVTHSKNGYYNGLIFHRVINNFMIQGGDPTGTGCGGESIWGRAFEDEFTPELHNLRGALCMANSGKNTNGSQFFIVQAKSCPENMIEEMKDLFDYFPDDCIENYEKLGGTPWLDYHHTVFGQVTDGMSVVDDIANVRCGAGDRPEHDVVIESIEITEA